MSYFSVFQVNDFEIIKGTHLCVSYGNWNSSFEIITLTYQHRDIHPVLYTSCFMLFFSGCYGSLLTDLYELCDTSRGLNPTLLMLELAVLGSWFVVMAIVF